MSGKGAWGINLGRTWGRGKFERPDLIVMSPELKEVGLSPLMGSGCGSIPLRFVPCLETIEGGGLLSWRPYCGITIGGGVISFLGTGLKPGLGGQVPACGTYEPECWLIGGEIGSRFGGATTREHTGSNLGNGKLVFVASA